MAILVLDRSAPLFHAMPSATAARTTAMITSRTQLTRLRGGAGAHEFTLEFLGVPALQGQIHFGNLERRSCRGACIGFTFASKAPILLLVPRTSRRE